MISAQLLVLLVMFHEICGSIENFEIFSADFEKFVCNKGEFTCASGHCVPAVLECNGKADCKDKSDETLHCLSKLCGDNLFRCAYGGCVQKNAFCNGVKECLDGSDEDDETCTFWPRFRLLAPTCTLPKHHDNGRWEYPKQYKPADVAAEGTFLLNKCNKGYESVNENIYSVCLNGNWSQSFACSKQCSLFNFTNVRDYNCTYNGKPRNCSLAIDGTYLNYECDLFYEKVGVSGFRLCQNGNWDNISSLCIPVCSKKKVDTGILSIGSTIVLNGDYPWQAAVFKNQSSHCGGSLLTNNVVLTAAHCVVTENVDGTVSTDPNLYEVAVGQYFREYKNPKDIVAAQYSKVLKIIPAESYRGRFNNYIGDIALLITEKFQFSLTVQPICRDTSNLFHLKDEQLGVVTGWGYLKENGNPSDEMRELKIPYRNHSECRQKLPIEYVQYYYSYDKLCAGFFNKSKALCNGDSGSPLVFEHRGRYYLHGVVSLAPRRDEGCDSNQYTLFTNVKIYVDFIEKIIREYST